jgi:hypothetical protein
MFQKRMFTSDRMFMLVLAVGGLGLLAVLAAVVSGGGIDIQGPAVEAPASVRTVDRVRQAEAARLQGLAGETVNLYGSTAWVRAVGLTRAQRAEVARWTGLAGETVNLFGSTAWVHAVGLTRAQRAEAARWTGMAIADGNPPEQISPAIARLIGR